MKKKNQLLILGSFIIGTVGIILLLYFTNFIEIPTKPVDIGLWIGFIIFWGASINEGILWIKNGKRSDLADIVAILFLFVTVFLITRNVLLSFVGAFSIYLLFGIEELKEYEILNKVVLISVITYNFIFIVGILDEAFNKEGHWQDTAFSLSFWLMLILGFAFFGRKYMVVFRFMSVQYLTLLLYIIAWLVIVMVQGIVNQNTTEEVDISQYIYIALIITNFVIYVFSGPLINLLMGYKKEDDEELNELVREVAEKVGMNPKRIQVRYGNYPIINAMAYGAFWNMNMAIIAPDKHTIPKDELKGVIAHELGHLKKAHTLILTVLSSIEIIIFWLLKWPVTMYDFVFKPDQPIELWQFLVISFGVSILLYIFVRDLEGHSDKIAREAGYDESISKGLYNLESFYATSHEIGLDATLLSDEKPTVNTQMGNYLATSQYLNKMIVDPSRGTLLSNFINSHPPSFHRIPIILNEEQISPIQEAFMPVTFLWKKNAWKFLNRTKGARERYLQIVDRKILELFSVTTIKEFNEQLARMEFHEYKLGKRFAYLNRITGERQCGKLVSLSYSESATESIQYHVQLDDSQEPKSEIIINPAICKEVPIALDSYYKFRKEGILKLEKVDLSAFYQHPRKTRRYEDPYYKYLNTGVLYFSDLDGNEIEKPVFDTKMPIPYEIIKDLEERPIFLKKAGTYEILKTKSITLNLEKPYIDIEAYKYIPNQLASDLKDSPPYSLTSDNHVINFEKLYFPVHHDDKTFLYEKAFLEFLIEKNLRVDIILKKAVNSEIDGHISTFSLDAESNNEKIKNLTITSIFGEEFDLEMSKIDGIFLNFPQMVVQKVADVSIFTKLINKIQRIRHPERIF